MMSKLSIHVRQAGTEDLDFIVASNIAMASETEGKTLDPEIVLAGVQKGLRDPNRSIYFIAEIGGRRAGQTMITTEWSDWRNGFCWWIQSVFVVAEFRRKGVFRALYGHIRELARQREDVCGIRLYVHEENKRAIQTYKDLGMAHTPYQVCEEVWPPLQGSKTGIP